MYAKVMKRKKDTEEQTDAHTSSHSGLHPEINVAATNRKTSLVEVNRNSWSSHDSMEVQRKEIDCPATMPNSCMGAAVVQSESDASVLARIGDDAEEASNPKTGRSYEAVNSDISKQDQTNAASYDPNYEILRPQQRVIADNADYRQASNVGCSGTIPRRNSTAAELAPVTYSVPFKQHRQTSNASSEDPGYEKVRLRRRIDTDQDTDSEPNYESMPHDSGEPNYASVCRPGDSDTDPNYESVNHGDPNYESVKYMSVTRAEEPPYEQVNAYQSEVNPDGYEKVKKHSFDADYERIHLERSAESIGNGDTTDDEQYVQV